MRTVELLPGLRSSALGFGCGPALGSVDRARSTRAIEVAFLEGITHFDVAPSYGYGEAEALLGTCLSNRRDQAVICTKFGIEATFLARVGRPLKGAVRGLLRRKGKAQTVAGATVSRRMLRPVPIEPVAMVNSVERSLRQLRTDWLDILLLHEPNSVVEDIDALFEASAELKASGKIRAFGIALGQDGASIHASYLNRFDILQYCAPRPKQGQRFVSSKPSILFSPFADPTERKQDALNRLQRENPQSVILCSMFTEAHIRQNASLFGEAGT